MAYLIIINYFLTVPQLFQPNIFRSIIYCFVNGR